MCTAAAEVMSARKGGHNRTPALQTLVQETCWHQCVLCGTHLPALGSGLPRRLQQGHDPGPGRLLPTGQMAGLEKMLYSKPTSAGSWDEANEQLWKLHSQWQGKVCWKPQQLQRDQGAQPWQHSQA